MVLTEHSRMVAELARIARETPREYLSALVGALEQAKTEVLMRACGRDEHERPADQNVSVEAVAERLGISASYIYKNADSLPFVRRVGRRVVCSLRSADRWMAQQRRG
jgi:predicted DNA-binding transcriptional regulator AlpA